jgi:hypothetical protein
MDNLYTHGVSNTVNMDKKYPQDRKKAGLNVETGYHRLKLIF